MSERKGPFDDNVTKLGCDDGPQNVISLETARQARDEKAYLADLAWIDAIGNSSPTTRHLAPSIDELYLEASLSYARDLKKRAAGFTLCILLLSCAFVASFHFVLKTSSEATKEITTSINSTGR